MTKTIDLDSGWKFCAGEVLRYRDVPHMLCYDMTKAGSELGVTELFLNENAWTDVTLPHDWNAFEPADEERGICNNGYKQRGIGWYYLSFHMPAFTDDESVLLEFEGVMGDTLVFINGARALRNHSGYNGFYTEAAPYLIPDADNMIAIRVDTTCWEGWWYEGAGIYRPVHLHIRPAVHFKHLSAFASPIKTADGWKLNLSAAVESNSDQPLDCCVNACLEDKNGTQVAAQMIGAATAAPFASAALAAELPVENVSLWDLDDPVLYNVVFTLSAASGEVLDTLTVRCGFRDIQWTADQGMLLNGKPVRVNGICCHQDHAGVGIAVNKTIVRYRISQLKKMGCNAYRCAHHMPWEYLLDVCDELGMLVMDENRHFNVMDETMDQVDDMVLRGRNHPSVFLYSLFNEEYWQNERRGFLIARKLAQRVRALDATRAITAAMNIGELSEKSASDVTDVAGMNYFISDFPNFAKHFPGKPLIGTENGPIFCTRGESENDEERHVYGGYGDCTSPFGELMGDTLAAADAAPHVAGVFMWGGFDYRGEPYPFTWPSVFSNWGFSDVCGFRKDTSWMLESFYSAKPVIHITPHWNHPEGKNVRVCVFSNAEKVQLFLNGEALPVKETSQCRTEWNVPFAPGELKAVGTLKDGTQITDCVRTAGKAERMQAEIIGGVEDNMLLVNVHLLDGNGVPVVDDDREIRISLDNGSVCGAGNGNPNAAQCPDIADHALTFHGLCQFVVRAERGCAAVLTSPGLPSCALL